MGLSATSDLGLDLGPPPSSPAAARSVAGFLREAGAAGEGRVAKLEEYVRCLEEERRKIEGFKRELPLCMLVLTDVIGAMKEELRRNGEAGACRRPVLEEFMPVKRKLVGEEGGAKQGDEDLDKVNWMSSAQLWSDNSSTNTSSTASITIATTNNAGSCASSRKSARERAEGDPMAQEDENPLADSNCRNGGGAFLAFKGVPGYQGGRPRKEEKVAAEVAPPPPDLSFLASATKPSRAAIPPTAEDRWSGWSRSGSGSRGEVSVPTQPAPPQPPSRKARRCWSPELHRRFVDTLQQLGGPEVATPKQIRELMKVDGLTNDEVKSHLQKYRLHTRKPVTPNSANQSVVMFGGLWLSQEGYPAAKESTSQSGSPHGPLQLANAAQRMSMMGSGDSCEEEEDEKSESYTWKGHTQCGEEAD